MPGNGTGDQPLGDVVADHKGVRLVGTDVNLSEGLFALPTSDGSKESWLFAGQCNGNVLLQFNGTAGGVELFAEYDLAQLLGGEIASDDPIFGIRLGYYPDQESQGRLVIAVARKEDDSDAPLGFVRFDPLLGQILNAEATIIANDTRWTYGVEFSSNSSKLY